MSVDFVAQGLIDSWSLYGTVSGNHRTQVFATTQIPYNQDAYNVSMHLMSFVESHAGSLVMAGAHVTCCVSWTISSGMILQRTHAWLASIRSNSKP